MRAAELVCVRALFKEHVRRFESDGKVYRGIGIFGDCVGRVESNGLVYDGLGFFSTCVGKAESPHIFGGGAALLLLIR